MAQSIRQRSFWKWAFAAACGMLGSLLLIWLTLGRMAAEKIATALALPAGALWLMMILAAWYLFWSRQFRGGIVLLCITALYWTMGNGYVADAVARSLEEPYVSINPLETTEPFDAVVVLGGGGGRGANGRLQGSTSGDRMILAAQLYHRKLTRHIICTGHRIESMSPAGVDPAETSRDVLTNLGVAENDISMLGGRNTTEEMIALGKQFQDADSRVGLVTSAWHMPRAMRLADRNGFHPSPLPADFWSGYRGTDGPTIARVIESMIPNAGAMLVNWYCSKERLGMLVGR